MSSSGERYSGTSEAKQAFAALEWFQRLIADPDTTQGALNATARDRITRLTGRQRLLKADLVKLAEALWQSSPEQHIAIAYFVCGFTDQEIEFMGDMQPQEVEDLLQKFFEKKVKRARQAIGKRASNDIPELNDLSDFGDPQPDKGIEDTESISVLEEPDDEEDDDMEEGDDEDLWKGELGTSLTADPIKDYLKNIGKVMLLNAEQEVHLAKAIEAGKFAQEMLDGRKYPVKAETEELEILVKEGKAAYEMLISANLRLVVSIAKRYTGRGLSFLDLIEEGNLGVIRAVDKFDFERGYKFSTYATWWIKQAITRGMGDTSRTIRLPVHMIEKVNRIEASIRALTTLLGQRPTDEEIMEEASVTQKELKIYYEVLHLQPISLSTPMGEDGDSELGDILGEDENSIQAVDKVLQNETSASIRQLLDTFTEREAGVIMMRFGLHNGTPMTLDEVGKVYGVSRERIRQVEAKTMSKLRHPSRAHLLRGYFDHL